MVSGLVGLVTPGNEQVNTWRGNAEQCGRRSNILITNMIDNYMVNFKV